MLNQEIANIAFNITKFNKKIIRNSDYTQILIL